VSTARDMFNNPVGGRPERPPGLAGLAEIRQRAGLVAPVETQPNLHSGNTAQPAQSSSRLVGAPRRLPTAPARPAGPAPARSPQAAAPSAPAGAARGGLGALRAATAAVSGRLSAPPSTPAPARRTQPAAMASDPFAERGAPPPRGAGWFAFLNWACRGTVEPTPEDTRLALLAWSGRLVIPEELAYPDI
jgi:hypothetical protein